MISTGMHDLDDMLSGGIPKGSRVLYSMEPGVNGLLFMISALAGALSNGKTYRVIPPHTTVDSFRHDAEILLAGRSRIKGKNLLFLGSVDRERIQKSARSAKASAREWEARIWNLCSESRMDAAFVHFGPLSEDFGIERALLVLSSCRAGPQPAVIIEHLNLGGARLIREFIEKHFFDLVISITSSTHSLQPFSYFTLHYISWIPNIVRSVPFIIAWGRIVPYIPRIIVTGPAKAGKSTFVSNATEHGLSVDRGGEDGTPATVAMDTGWLRWKDCDITLYGTPCEPRLDLLLPRALRHAMGVILILDIGRRETLPCSRYLAGLAMAEKIPFLIADEIRKSVGTEKDVPVVFISANWKADVASVLESSIDFITRVAY